MTTPCRYLLMCYFNIFNHLFRKIKKQSDTNINYLHYLCIVISKNTIKLLKALDKKKHRINQGEFVAEGPKVVGDLLKTMRPKRIFACEKWYSSHIDIDCDEFMSVTEAELSRLSFLQHPQDVIATFPLPCTETGLEYSIDKINSQLCLALDGVQDPGNLGTIIRIADWFGVDTIFCSPDSADAYNPKVVQATMGSISRVKVFYTDLVQIITRLPKETDVYGTFLNGKNIYESQLSSCGLIVMGNEGNGISKDIESTISRRLFIPPFPKDHPTAESLNVAIATALCLAEFRRRVM